MRPRRGRSGEQIDRLRVETLVAIFLPIGPRHAPKSRDYALIRHALGARRGDALHHAVCQARTRGSTTGASGSPSSGSSRAASPPIISMSTPLASALRRKSRTELPADSTAITSAPAAASGMENVPPPEYKSAMSISSRPTGPSSPTSPPSPANDLADELFCLRGVHLEKRRRCHAKGEAEQLFLPKALAIEHFPLLDVCARPGSASTRTILVALNDPLRMFATWPRGKAAGVVKVRPRCCGCARYVARQRGKYPGRLHLVRSGAPRAVPWGHARCSSRQPGTWRSPRHPGSLHRGSPAGTCPPHRTPRRARSCCGTPTAACFPSRGAREQPRARPRSRPCAKAPQRRCRSSRQAGSRKRDVARGRLLARTAPPRWGHAARRRLFHLDDTRAGERVLLLRQLDSEHVTRCAAFDEHGLPALEMRDRLGAESHALDRYDFSHALARSPSFSISMFAIHP